MNNFFQRLAANFIPFVMIGIAIALMIGLFIMFSYVLLWGLLIGIVLCLTASIKEYFFPNKNSITLRGRIIEYKNNRK
jgi:hypothetical protein